MCIACHGTLDWKQCGEQLGYHCTSSMAESHKKLILGGTILPI